jgi:hypothetical protein
VAFEYLSGIKQDIYSPGEQLETAPGRFCAVELSLSSIVVTVCTISSDTSNFCVPTRQCVYVFLMIFTSKIDYIPEEHQPIVPCNVHAFEA